MTDIRNASAHFDGYDDGYDDFYEGLDERDDEVPRAPLALDPPQRTSLARAVRAGLRANGCDNTLQSAQAWARREKVRWGWLRDALEERGGFCDCEVMLNVLDSPD